jgi:hypothetical protein
MNFGTKVRTILAVATVINSGAIATGIAEFENPTVNLIYKILSFCATAVILFINTWYNNDFTEEACIGTGITRQLKAEGKEDYFGDYFFDDDEDFGGVVDEEESEVEDEQ